MYREPGFAMSLSLNCSVEEVENSWGWVLTAGQAQETLFAGGNSHSGSSREESALHACAEAVAQLVEISSIPESTLRDATVRMILGPGFGSSEGLVSILGIQGSEAPRADDSEVVSSPTTLALEAQLARDLFRLERVGVRVLAISDPQSSSGPAMMLADHLSRADLSRSSFPEGHRAALYAFDRQGVHLGA